MRRPTFAHTLMFGGGGGTYTGGGGGGGAPGGGGGGNASLSSYSGSEHPLTSKCLPPIEPHTACALGGPITTRPAPNNAAAPNGSHILAMRLTTFILHRPPVGHKRTLDVSPMFGH